jgi:hypothetical protein
MRNLRVFITSYKVRWISNPKGIGRANVIYIYIYMSLSKDNWTSCITIVSNIIVYSQRPLAPYRQNCNKNHWNRFTQLVVSFYSFQSVLLIIYLQWSHSFFGEYILLSIPNVRFVCDENEDDIPLKINYNELTSTELLKLTRRRRTKSKNLTRTLHGLYDDLLTRITVMHGHNNNNKSVWKLSKTLYFSETGATRTVRYTLTNANGQLVRNTITFPTGQKFKLLVHSTE